MRLLLLAVLVILAACGPGDDEEQPDPTIADAFPHVEGAEQIDAARFDELPFDVAASDAVAALYIVDQEAMQIGSYYSAGLLEGVDGWIGSGIGATQSAMYGMYQNGERVAAVTLVSGRVFTERPDLVSELDLTPFDEIRHDIKSDETLIHAQFFTCEEAEIEECLQAVFNARAPGL